MNLLEGATLKKMKNVTLKDKQRMYDMLFQENNGICPILKHPTNVLVIDHIHRRSKKNKATEQSGTIRGLIDRGANCLLGVVENNYHRYITQSIPLPEILRNMADYIEKGAFEKDGNYFSHWSENGNGDLIKSLNIPFKISDYNRYVKVCKKEKMKPLKYQKNINKKWALEFQKYNLTFTNISDWRIEELLEEMENGKF